MLKGLAKWFVRKAGEDWLRGLVRSEMDTVKRDIEAASLRRQTLDAYDKTYNDFVQHLAYVVGRRREEQDGTLNTKDLMRCANDLNRARMQLLNVCGPRLTGVLKEAGTDWLYDSDKVATTATKLADDICQAAADDRAEMCKALPAPM